MNKIYKAYCWKIVGLVLGSTGPSTFLLVVIAMDREAGIISFLMIGSVMMLSMSILFERQKWNDGTVLRALNKRTIVPLFIAGISTSLLYVCYTRSMQMKSVTEAVLVIRISPLICILLASKILKERIRNWIGIIFAIAICLIGIIVMDGIHDINIQSFANLFILFALATAFLSSLSSVMERMAQKNGELPDLFIAGIEMLIGAVVLFALTLGSRKILFGSNVNQFMLLAYLGFCTIGIPTFASLRAYKLADNYSRFAFLQYFFPIFAAISAYLINGERGLNYGKLAMGFVLISIGTWIANRSIEKRKSILFVCNGNIHRSVIAEICLKQELESLDLGKKFEIISRGIQGCCGTVMPRHENMTQYSKEWFVTKPILERMKVDLSSVSKRIAVPVTERDIVRASVVYSMELGTLNGVENSLLRQFPQYSSKICFFGMLDGIVDDMPDCGGSNDEEKHLLVNERIVFGIRNNVHKILNQVENGGKR